VVASWSPDGDRIATVSWDGAVTIWHATNGEAVFELGGKQDGEFGGGVWWSPDGRRVVVAKVSLFDKGTVQVWDASTGTSLLKVEGTAMGSAAINPDGTRLLTGSFNQTAQLWDTAIGRLAGALKGHRPEEPDPIGAPVRGAAFSPDESRLLTYGWQSNIITIWDARAGTELGRFRGGDGQIESAAWSPDGGRFVAVAGDLIIVFDARTCSALLTFRWLTKGEGGHVKSLSFSPDGTRLLGATSNFLSAKNNGQVKIWDAATGAEIRTLPRLGTSASWSPDGSRLLTGCEISGERMVGGRPALVAAVWDARTGAEIIAIPDAGNVPTAAWSPDGSRLVAGGKIWDAHKGTHLATLSRTDLEEISWNPDGSRLVAPGPNGTTIVLDAASGVEVLALKSPTEVVRSASWSPDGSRIRAVSSDGTIRIWDARPVNTGVVPENVPRPPWLVRP
jgi:WD40 repeat protein